MNAASPGPLRHPPRYPARRSAWARLGVAVPLLAATVGCGGKAEPKFTEPMMLGGQEVAPEVLSRGSRIYALYCVSCHAVDGSGKGNAARSLKTKPRDFREANFRYTSGPEGSLPTDDDLMRTVRDGLPDAGMPAWDGLAQEDREAVIQYLKTFSPRWASEKPTARTEPES